MCMCMSGVCVHVNHYQPRIPVHVHNIHVIVTEPSDEKQRCPYDIFGPIEFTFDSDSRLDCVVHCIQQGVLPGVQYTFCVG